MQSLLNELISNSLFAFLLIFMRFGIALMIMPGIGDSFVSPQIRLLFALAISLVLTPVLSALGMPAMPSQTVTIGLLLLSEAFIGVFIGTVMRILTGALDTAGSVISMQAGFSNALVFNPVTATQGSLIGGLYSTLGVTLLLVTNMHHFMLAAVVDSYGIFPPAKTLPAMDGFSEVIVRTVSVAFKIGVQMALPFIIVGLLIQIGFGLLGRLMPQVQIFFLALPVQIGLSMIILAMVISAGMGYWLDGYETLVEQMLDLK